MESNPTSSHSSVYIGTYAEVQEAGILHYSLDLKTGELSLKQSVKAGKNPSYLVIDNARKFLYAANEIDEGGNTTSFSISQTDGSLALLNQQPCNGAPCHVSLDQTNKVLLAADYPNGTVTVYTLKENGEIGASTDFVQFEGSSINKERQEKAHAHYIITDPTNRFAFVVDLGSDKIHGFKIDIEKGKLTRNDPDVAFSSKPGAGPRHFVFHPNGRHAYLLNELDGTVVLLNYDSDKGVFIEIDKANTLPEDFKGENTCAAIKLLPNGKFLYASNRGHDSIVVYAIDQETGKLTLVQHISTGGKGPRDFEIDPTGRFLIAANQQSDNILVFTIESETGGLTKTQNEIQVSKPVCVKII